MIAENVKRVRLLIRMTDPELEAIRAAADNSFMLVRGQIVEDPPAAARLRSVGGGAVCQATGPAE